MSWTSFFQFYFPPFFYNFSLSLYNNFIPIYLSFRLDIQVLETPNLLVPLQILCSISIEFRGMYDEKHIYLCIYHEILTLKLGHFQQL